MEFRQTEKIALISREHSDKETIIQDEKKEFRSGINWTLFKHLILLICIVGIGIWLQTPSGTIIYEILMIIIVDLKV